MSRWSSILQKRLYEVVAGFYQNYPIDARGALSAWIEEHVESSQLNPEVHSEECFHGFMLQMTEELGRLINAIADTEHHWLTYKNILQTNLTFIQQRYGNDPKSLFRTLKQYLEQERRLLNQPMPEPAEAAGIMVILNDRVAPSSQLAGLFAQMQVVLQQLVLLRDDLCYTRQRIVELDEQINGLPNGTALYGHPFQHEMARTQDTMQRKNHEFHQAMMELGLLQDETLKQLGALNEEVLKELDGWIVEQRRKVNGFPVERNLDEIESLFVYIAHGLVQVYHQVVEAELLQQNAETYAQRTEYPRDVYQNHQNRISQITHMIHMIVTKTFIVEVQPFQIIRSKAAPAKQKLNSPFIRVRLLVGSALNPTLIVPVKASLASEKEARKHYENPKAKFQPKVKLVNEISNLCCDQTTKRFVAEFRGVTLAEKLEKRSKKKSLKPANVKEELAAAAAAAGKWCFVFQAEFTVLNLKIPIETSSNPVCITCNQSSQDYISWGSLLWDSEFAELNRSPFTVPNEVDCEKLLEVLSQKFFVQTGRRLSDDHKRFLKHKLYGDAPRNGKVSWEMFNQKTVTKHVTFWKYIYEILKLCEKSAERDPKKQHEANQHFQKYWAEGKVEGFIIREEMEKKLKDSEHDGTFMLRFSDTCPGSVTVNLFKNGWEKKKLAPYSFEDLSTVIPLWRRISDKPCLTYLYPNIRKEEAFPTPKPTSNDRESHLLIEGYIRTYLEETVDMSSVQRSRKESSAVSASSSSHPFPAANPHSAGSLSPPSTRGFQEASEHSTSQDQFSSSSSMDEDEATDF